MNNKKTEDLMEQLTLKNLDYKEYLKENEDSFVHEDLSLHWKSLITKTGMKKNDIINKADIGYTFFYDVIHGRKNPSRDTICRLIVAMHLSVDDCQATLRLYNWAGLYPKVKRDSIIIYALSHDLSLFELNELLSKNDELHLNY